MRAKSRSTIRIGVIGCGRAAKHLHLPTLARLPGVTVAALADIDAARMQAAGDRWGVANRYPDYHELINDPSINVVLISVPTCWHSDVFLATTRSGKPAYIEKPLALNLEQADQMLATAARFSDRSVVGFNLRSHRLIQEAREVVRRGALGAIALARMSWMGGTRDLPDWARDRASGGGALYEMGVHHFDLWRYLLDTDVAQVEAQSVSNQCNDSAVTVLGRMRNGILACSTLSLGGEASHDIEIAGETSTLRFSLYRGVSMELRPVSRLRQFGRRLWQLPQMAKAARYGGDFLDSYRRHWLSFLKSIQDGDPPPATLQDGREALTIVLTAIGSLNRYGKP